MRLRLISPVLLLMPWTIQAADLIDELKEIPPAAQVVVHGTTQPVSPEQTPAVLEAMKTLLKGCRSDSKTQPSAFKPYDKYPYDWDRARDALRRTSYIDVSLGKLEKLPAGNKLVYTKYIMLETPPGNWPAKYLAVNDGEQTIRFGGCNGFDVVKLICMPGIMAYMPEGYAAACKVTPVEGEAGMEKGPAEPVR